VLRQEETGGEHIDVMIVAKLSLMKCFLFVDAEAALGDGEPDVYSVQSSMGKLQDGNHFLNAWLNGEKVFLLGNEDELRKMGGIRMLRREPSSPSENRGSAGMCNAVSMIQK